MKLRDKDCNELNMFGEILRNYFPGDEDYIVRKGNSGYNNTTRYITKGNEQYILRIYETHKEEEKVKLEHQVLLALGADKDINVEIPKPIYTIKGGTFIKLENFGQKIACLYSYIDGVNPVFNNNEILYSFGVTSGNLLRSLEKIPTINQPFVYRPYYEIEYTHANCDLSFVTEWCTKPPSEFKEFKTMLASIRNQLIDFQKNLPKIKILPHQMIHGDLNESNVLTKSNKEINGIIDFEFVTRDLRAMEVAVCLSEIIAKESNKSVRWEKINAYRSGIISVLSLLKPEIEALPTLIQLRRLDVFIHFLGRYLDGIDNSSIVKEQIIKTAAGKNWLDDESEKLVTLWKP